jgi:hypothetical protein
MTRQHVDYAGSPFPGATLDTGSTAAAAIRPILNGDVATQATFQRPDENLRTRTETIRTELEQLKYLSQADRALVMSLEPVTPAGTITWNGTVAGGGGGTGTFVLTAGKSLTTRPFLSPRVSTPGKIINRGLKFQTNLTVAGPINPPRAYGDANKYNVQFVNQTGGPVTVTYDPLLFRFTVNTDTAVRTKTDVINAFNAAATSAGQGITATIDSGFGTDIFASGDTFIQGDPADYMVFAGAADAELHQIQDTTFASFFTDPLNAMEENDVLAIWYDDHVNGLFGGRQQSLVDSPEAPTISLIPVGSLFLARRFPERLHIALPIATVVNNTLLFADGSLALKGVATPLTGGASELPPPVAPETPAKFLRMRLSGAHTWENITSDMIQTILAISSFGPSTPVVEVGVTVSAPVAFTASYTAGPPTTANLVKDSLGAAIAQALTPPATSFNANSLPASYQKLNTNEFFRFQLTADAGATPDVETCDIQWQRFFYFGKNAVAAPTIDQAFVKALDDAAPGNRTLRPGRAHTFAMSGLVNEYVYFAYDTAHGALVSLFDNTAMFPITFVDMGPTVDTVTTENGAGVAVNYRVYRSTFPLTGNINFTTG